MKSRLMMLFILIFLAAKVHASIVVQKADRVGGVLDVVNTGGTYEYVRDEDAGIPGGYALVEVYNTLSTGLFRGLIEYEIQSLPLNIVSATLNLFPYGGVGTPFNVTLIGYAGDGAITLADGLLTGETLTTFNLIPGSSTVDVDVTSFISSLVVAGLATHAGFRIQLTDESRSPNRVGSIGEKYSGYPRHPTLSIIAVPAPSTELLLSIGFVGLWFIRKKRKFDIGRDRLAYLSGASTPAPARD